MRLQTQNPAVYSLFQGDQWTTRLEIGFTALFAAVAAGLLVLLIALTLIILKLGFLLLLVAGPFFLIVGVHPGFGRVVAIRWFEMLVGVLLKQVAVALVLSILLYCYSLIMSTTDQELPWALKIMMISLVTVAVFIYRKPFQHLFSSVGYGMLGANERAEVSWRESAFGFRRVTATAAGTVVPGAGARPARPGGRAAPRPMARRSRRRDRRPAPPRAASAPPPRTGCRAVPTADSHSAARQWPAAGVGTGRTAPPLPLPTNGAPPTANGGSAGWARGGGGAGGGSRGPAQPPVRTDRPDARRAHAGHARADAVRPRQSGTSRPTGDADGVHAAGTDAVDAGARAAVLVAVPPPAPVAGPGHGTLARPAAAAVRRRRHRARRPWLLRDPTGGATGTRRAAATPTPTPSAERARHAARRRPAHRPPASSPAASSAGATPAATAGGANIYQWLPFTQSDLTAAAKTTLAFATVYANRATPRRRPPTAPSWPG